MYPLFIRTATHAEYYVVPEFAVVTFLSVHISPLVLKRVSFLSVTLVPSANPKYLSLEAIANIELMIILSRFILEHLQANRVCT